MVKILVAISEPYLPVVDGLADYLVSVLGNSRSEKELPVVQLAVLPGPCS